MIPSKNGKKDFPAAHSMDTTWFAIDADGCVGVFETGEDGAMPMTAASGGGTGEPSFDTFYFDAARIGRAVASEEDEGAKGDVLEFHAAERWREDDTIQSASARAIVVLRDPREGERPYRGPSVEEAFNDVGWIVVHESRPRVIASREPLSDVKAIAKRKDVRAILLEGDLSEVLYEAGGTFSFGHRSDTPDGYQPGLYAREPHGAPSKPLKITDVPDNIREHLAAIKLPLRFADAEQIHLADHLRDEDCAMWAEKTSLRGRPLGETQEKGGGAGAIAKVLGWFRGSGSGSGSGGSGSGGDK